VSHPRDWRELELGHGLMRCRLVEAAAPQHRPHRAEGFEVDQFRRGSLTL
jgi:hypothetical protein